jgi:hypothetical protein
LSAQPDSDRSLTATNTGTVDTDASPLVSPAPARLNLAGAADTNAPVATPPADTSAASGDAGTDTNAAPFDASKEAKVGQGDITPPDQLAGLSREQLQAKVSALTDDLTAANTESEYFRQQWQELKLRDEALGAEALTVDEQKIEDKLVQAVKELYQSEMRRREALLLLDKLIATTQTLMKTAPHYDPKVRADYEVAMRASRDYLAGRNGTAIPIGLSLMDGQIADLNPELNAVVLNLGKSQGVKEGMPFLIFQDNAAVGTIKVVLARDLVSVGLLEKLQPHVTLKVGDRVAVNAQP